MSTATPITEEIYYPSSDGEPMGETFIHVRAIMLLFQALEDFLSDRRPDDYVAADMFWYWEEGNPNARCAPDIMVVPGVGWSIRRSFFSWRENGAVPAVVFEMASENTWREDVDRKKRLYAERGVKEYFIFDPEGLYVQPRLQGFRLHGDDYTNIEKNAEDRLLCEQLGFFLSGEGLMLRLFDAVSGEPVLTREEQIAKAEAKAEQAEAERQRAEALEAEVARLRALLQEKQSTGDEGGQSPQP